MSVENRYAAARRIAESHGDFVDLINTNFHSCGLVYPNEPIVETLKGHFSDSPNRLYAPDPQGGTELREAIAEFYSASLSINSEQIIVTASASECYSHIFAAVSKRGDGILLPRPGYPVFEDVARRSGLEVTFYDQLYEAGWQIDPDRVEAAITPRSRFLVLISPNNPTGSVLGRDRVAQLLRICDRNDLTLIVDEVFSDYLYDGTALIRPAALAQEIDVPLPILTINGASKLFASPDVKVSWIAATGPRQSREEIVDLLSAQNDLFLSCSQPSQVVVASMLRHYPTFTRAVASETAKRRAVLLDALTDVPDIAVVAPQGGIHLPLVIGNARVPEWMDDEAISVSLLEEMHVAAHPGYLYGFGEAGIRQPVLVTSFLSPPEVIRDGVKRIDTYFGDLSGK